jgi:hypothetical protein
MHFGRCDRMTALGQKQTCQCTILCPLCPRKRTFAFGHTYPSCATFTQQFLKAAYGVLFSMPYLARIELQDAESPAPNMHIQPSGRGSDMVIAFSRSNSANLLHSMIWFHAWATSVTTPPLPPHRTTSEAVAKPHVSFGPQADIAPSGMKRTP